jgi:hypothetical protein
MLHMLALTVDAPPVDEDLWTALTAHEIVLEDAWAVGIGESITVLITLRRDGFSSRRSVMSTLENPTVILIRRS